MGIGAQGTGGLGDRSGGAQLVIQEVAESRVAGAATSEGSSPFNVERKDVLFKLMTDIEPGANGVSAMTQAERVLKLIKVLSPALGEALDRAKRGEPGDVERRQSICRIREGCGSRRKEEGDTRLAGPDFI